MSLLTGKTSKNLRRLWLLFSVFIIATSGLVYELIAGSISSYLLGDAVTQFSLVIGVFLSAMGLGAYIVKFIENRLLLRFLQIELVIALIGGMSSILIFATAAFFGQIFSPIFYLLCAIIGALVGAEIPLLIRIVHDQKIGDVVSTVLAVDYLGALLGSLLFPFVILPYIGISRASVIFGIMNIAIVWMGFAFLSHKQRRTLRWQTIAVSILLFIAFLGSNRWVRVMEDILYQDKIIFAESTSYQRIVMTRWKDDIRLFLNGNLQFASKDEARYHETLVHPLFHSLRQHPKKVLLLGGGDGLAVREIIKYDGVEKIDLVDIDPVMTEISSSMPILKQMNQNALASNKVHIFHQDAMLFVQQTDNLYDAIIVDLPDPNSDSLSKLYSVSFYQLLVRRLSENGGLVTQATSPFFARKAYWSIVRPLEEVRDLSPQKEIIEVHPFHQNVPSFGEWGFVMLTKYGKKPQKFHDEIALQFLHDPLLPGLFIFGKDMSRVDAEPNRIFDPILYQYYDKGWKEFR